MDLGRSEKNSLLRTMLWHADVLERHLAGFGWQIAVAEEPTFFTSDNPVSLFDPEGRVPQGFSAFVPPRGSMVLLPLDPRHVLVGSQDPFGPTIIECTSDLALTTRSLTLRGFFEQLILPLELAEEPSTVPPTREKLNEPAITIEPSSGGEVPRVDLPDFFNPVVKQRWLDAGGEQLLAEWNSQD
ncbi:MAG: DUF4238 domain-containing protein [Acidimicrobiales bacterium]